MSNLLGACGKPSRSSANEIHAQASSVPYSGPTHSSGRWIMTNFPPTFSGKRIASRSSSRGSVSQPARIQVWKSCVMASPVSVALMPQVARKLGRAVGRDVTLPHLGNPELPEGIVPAGVGDVVPVAHLDDARVLDRRAVESFHARTQHRLDRRPARSGSRRGWWPGRSSTCTPDVIRQRGRAATLPRAPRRTRPPD